MKQIFKYLKNKKLKSKFLKQFIDFGELFFDKDKTVYPNPLDLPEGEKFLILTPHADDETLGSGGTILKLIKNNKDVSIILFSNNEDSIPNIDKIDTINVRENEFRKLLSYAGIKKYRNLNLSPSEFILNESNINKTTGLIKEFEPDTIILPSFYENHQAHRILNKILGEALMRLKNNYNILLSEVWSPIIPNIVINITEFIEQKREMIKIYDSQLQNLNYLDAITGLNKYRSITNLKGNGFCEAFIGMNSEEYRNLMVKK